MDLFVVTGTTRGLGEALARAIAGAPENELVCIARRAGEAGRTIVADLADAGAVPRIEAQLRQLVEGRSYGRAVLFNNAGIVSPVGPLDRVEGAELDRNLRVNLVAPMLLMGAFLRATGGHAGLRRIVNISSGAGRRPIFGWGAYCAAKAALDMASRVAALEAQQRGQAVEVVSLAPGVIDTPMQAVVRGAAAEDFVDVERFRQMKAEGVLRPADEVAADILRLEAEGKLAAEPVADLRAMA